MTSLFQAGSLFIFEINPNKILKQTKFLPRLATLVHFSHDIKRETFCKPKWSFKFQWRRLSMFRFRSLIKMKSVRSSSDQFWEGAWRCDFDKTGKWIDLIISEITAEGSKNGKILQQKLQMKANDPADADRRKWALFDCPKNARFWGSRWAQMNPWKATGFGFLRSKSMTARRHQKLFAPLIKRDRVKHKSNFVTSDVGCMKREIRDTIFGYRSPVDLQMWRPPPNFGRATRSGFIQPFGHLGNFFEQLGQKFKLCRLQQRWSTFNF